MRSGAQPRKGGVEVEFKSFVQRQVITIKIENVHLVVSIKVDPAKVVLVQEVVRDYGPPVVGRQHEHMRCGCSAEVQPWKGRAHWSDRLCPTTPRGHWQARHS